MASAARHVSAIKPDHILSELTSAVNGGRSAVLATIVETTGSVPRHAGTKMVVFADGAGTGTVGGGKVEAAIRTDALVVLAKRTPDLRHYTLQDPAKGDPGVCGGTMSVYLEPYMTPHTVFVVGAGHVGKAVIDLAHWLGYRTVAVDEREELLTPDALPHADVRFSGSVADAVEAHPISEDTSIVMVTKSHALDAEIAPLLVKTPARYIGAMGSTRRWESTRDLLSESGLTDEDLDRIHNPIGIDIGAETVEEIAVSIMSEIIASNLNATT